MKPKQIAIIDDDPDFRLALELLVRGAGYDTVSHPNGASFIATLASSRPAAAILDLSMPKVDGLTVLSALRERGEKMPVIVVTGSGRRDRTAARDRGAFAILEKPVDPADLEHVLTAAIAGHTRLTEERERRRRR